MRIEYEPPRKKQPVYACFKALLRIFVRKVRTVTLGGELSEPCLYLANHANKMGPMIYSMFFPVYHVNWGASQMLGNYRERYRYLREQGQDIPMRPVYYHKKKRLIVVGEECFLSDFGAAKKEEVAEAMRLKVNALYHRIEAGEFDEKK